MAVIFLEWEGHIQMMVIDFFSRTLVGFASVILVLLSGGGFLLCAITVAGSEMSVVWWANLEGFFFYIIVPFVVFLAAILQLAKINVWRGIAYVGGVVLFMMLSFGFHGLMIFGLPLVGYGFGLLAAVGSGYFIYSYGWRGR